MPISTGSLCSHGGSQLLSSKNQRVYKFPLEWLEHHPPSCKLNVSSQEFCPPFIQSDQELYQAECITWLRSGDGWQMVQRILSERGKNLGKSWDGHLISGKENNPWVVNGQK